jgi:sugar transferase (PEP-CTERM/EpsH1 system associated)
MHREAKLRILHIVHSLNTGGLERVVVDLAVYLKRKGSDQAICCLADRGNLAKSAEVNGVPLFQTNKGEGLDLLLPMRLSRIMKRGKYDLIHTHNDAGIVYGFPAASMCGIRSIVHTDHGIEPKTASHCSLNMIKKLFMKRTSCIVAVSQDLKRTIISDSGIMNHELKVVMNGIDPCRYYGKYDTSEIRKSVGIGRDRFIIGHIARLVPLKNQEFLLQIIRELKNLNLPITLMAVGEGPMRKRLQELCINYEIQNEVVFLGERTDIPQLLSIMDLFVLTSITEGISITILEAMAAGIPVLASKVGGNPEIIDDSISGFLINLNEPFKWIMKAKELFDDQHMRKRIGKQAQEVIRRKFSLDVMADQYERIYKNAAAYQ